ncbi:MAG TPA: DUF5947 family protein [Candidatus Sulfotelmatobacter sp.]|nr:DUF5947 family protein [Candidatus Sulfotelmatobacter sp.]
MLRQFTRRERRPLERCELCSLELGADHPHLIELALRRLICTCEACAILFSGQGVKFKRVPRRVATLSDFRLSDAEWDGLMVPINMAFFFKNSLENRVVAMYPSPAGAMESLLALESWNDIAAGNPVLKRMESDVEALLVNRLGSSRGQSEAEYYLLPIDECYKLVGLIRMHWKGLSGGTEVWQELGQYFGSLKARAVEIATSCDEEKGSRA